MPGVPPLATMVLATPWLAVALAAISTVALAVALGRRSGLGRRPLSAASMGAAVLAMLAMLAMLAYLNAYFAYLPRVGDVVGPRPWPVSTAAAVITTSAPRAFPAGVVFSLSIVGRHSGVGRYGAQVYVPPQYFTELTRRFPVLYMLHGSPGVPLDWFRGADAAGAGLAAARAGRPVILVAPRMSQSWLRDSECVDGKRFRAESYLLRDVLPAVDGQLRTMRSQTGRGVMGNSAGGFCALNLALRNPPVFGTAVGLSALTRPTYTYGSLADLFGTRRGLPLLVAQNTPAWLLRTRSGARSVRLRLDVGRSDHLARRQVEGFAALAAGLSDVAPVLVERPGGHTFRVWRPAVRDAVLWFGTLAGRAAQPGTGPATSLRAAGRTPSAGIQVRPPSFGR